MPDNSYNEQIRFEEEEAARRRAEEEAAKFNNEYGEPEEEETKTFLTEEEMKENARKYTENITGIDVDNMTSPEPPRNELPQEEVYQGVQQASVAISMDTLQQNPLAQSLAESLSQMMEDNPDIQEGDVALVQAEEEVINPPSEKGLDQNQSQTQNTQQNESQTQNEQSATISELQRNEMTESLEYIRANMLEQRKGLDGFLHKNVYIDKKAIESVNEQYFRDRAELLARYGKNNEELATSEALANKHAALNKLCKDAKPFDEKAFREMQMMAAVKGRNSNIDVIHFRPGKDGEPNQLSNVRVSGQSLTAKQLKQMTEAQHKIGKEDRKMDESLRSAKGNVRSFVGGDAQAQASATLMISVSLLLAALHKIKKFCKEDEIKAIENKIKKAVDMGETNIDLKQILDEVHEDFQNAQQQLKGVTNEVAEDVKVNDENKVEEEAQVENTSEEIPLDDKVEPSSEEVLNDEVQQPQQDSIESVMEDFESTTTDAPTNEAPVEEESRENTPLQVNNEEVEASTPEQSNETIEDVFDEIENENEVEPVTVDEVESIDSITLNIDKENSNNRSTKESNLLDKDDVDKDEEEDLANMLDR